MSQKIETPFLNDGTKRRKKSRSQKISWFGGEGVGDVIPTVTEDLFIIAAISIIYF